MYMTGRLYFNSQLIEKKKYVKCVKVSGNTFKNCFRHAELSVDVYLSEQNNNPLAQWILI